MKKPPLLFLILMLLSPVFVMANSDLHLQSLVDTAIRKGKIDTSSKIENKVIHDVIVAAKPAKKRQNI